MVEHGRTTESPARRPYQGLAMTDDLLADPISAYPGRCADSTLCQNIERYAGDRGFLSQNLLA
jgi:hypothetical protein